jgi:feruloyl esterase
MAILGHLLPLASLLIALQPSTAVAAASDQPEYGSFENNCVALAETIAGDIPSARVNIVQFVAAGTNITFPHNHPSCGRPGQVVDVDICRVAMEVETSAQSGIILETWLPRDYSGRFLSTGNGGTSGCK